MGNGLLTFMDNKKQFDHFFSNDEIIFFENEIDLIEKLNYYKVNKDKRIKIAKKGQQKYFQLFNEIDVAEYIIKRSVTEKSDYKPSWE